MKRPFPHYTQLDSMDCGPTCLRMIAKHYGRSYTLQNLRERSFITREGVSMLGVSDAAESIGFCTTFAIHFFPTYFSAMQFARLWRQEVFRKPHGFLDTSVPLFDVKLQ